MIWNPLIENETFNKNYVNQEKTLLAKKLKHWSITKRNIHFKIIRPYV